MIRYIFQRMQNFAYSPHLVAWRLNMRSQISLDASFARHEAKKEEIMKRGVAQDRGFRLIWKVRGAPRITLRRY